MVPGVEEPFTGYLEAGEGAGVVSDVCEEVRVLLRLLPVSLLNVLLRWTGQLKQVDRLPLCELYCVVLYCTGFFAELGVA